MSNYYNKYIKYKLKYKNLLNNYNQTGGELCDIIFNNNTHIYHFYDDYLYDDIIDIMDDLYDDDTKLRLPSYNLPPDSNISYKKYKFSEITLELFAAILLHCKKVNILIYLESNNNIEIIDRINDILSKIDISILGKKIDIIQVSNELHIYSQTQIFFNHYF